MPTALAVSGNRACNGAMTASRRGARHGRRCRLVETKLLLPRPRARAVDRAPARRAAGPGPGRPRLTLVSAPAGFGKTTLLASWLARLAATGRPAAWVSLDERDRDAPTFWTYVLRAVDRAAPGAATRGAGAAAVAGRRRIDSVLTALLNELSVLPGRPHPGPRRLPPRRGPEHPARRGLPARAPAAAGAPRDQHPRRPRAAAGPAARPRRAGRGPRRRPALHRRRRPRPTSTRSSALGLEPRRRGGPGGAAPKAGSPPCSWRPCRCRAATTPAGFIAGFAGDDRFVVDYLADEVLDRQPTHVRALPARAPRCSTG